MRTTLVLLIVTLFCAEVTAQENTSPVSIDSVRIILSKKGQSVDVEQLLHILPKNESGTDVSKFNIPLPGNATNSQLLMPGDKGFQVNIQGQSLIVNGKIPPEGRSVSAQYSLPLVRGSATMDQNLGMNVETLQVISTWTMGKTTLKVAGLGEARTHSMNGLDVLVTTGMNIKDGHIQVRLTGLGDALSPLMRYLSIASSVLFLCLGLVLWLRKRNRND